MTRIKNLTLQYEWHNIERHKSIQIWKALNSMSSLYISFKGTFYKSSTSMNNTQLNGLEEEKRENHFEYLEALMNLKKS